MALSSSLSAYTDVRDLLDVLRAKGGGLLTFRTEPEAQRWTQRAYKFRILWDESGEPPFYRLMSILSKDLPSNQRRVVFGHEFPQVEDLDGNPLDLTIEFRKIAEEPDSLDTYFDDAKRPLDPLDSDDEEAEALRALGFGPKEE